ncbi:MULTISPECIES: ABC transporter ATP-binding protein [unclassified Campylobacter]|uniref:ABC transporter ATP-binding protein n=1 Tax=unclassified Campylobacter TaxID=2593542 RepID=UPI0014743C0E|nr:MULTISPECIES: ABC transporter ATP-binding protein [unclassified Campylobacter]QKG29708.1 heme ABC transporter ChuBCD, ATP-binding protein [Campylobacter sp. RM16187]
MSVIVENLNFTYGAKEILKDISLNAKNGEFIGILGPNGCGKSTLLKNILRVLAPKSGIVKIIDKPLKDYSLKELAKTLGFVPQKSVLSMPLLVEDILLMGRFSHLKSQFSGYSKEDRQKVNQIMELLDISHFAKRIAHSLSGGEFQRVLLARALVSEPKILLLDEPTSALDLNYAIEIMKICTKLTKELNLLSIMVLHDLNLASLFCNEVLMLKDGKVKYKGSPKELYTKEILKEIYGLNCDVIEYKDNPFVIALKD